MANSIDDELAALTDRGLRRRMRAIDGPQAASLVVDGRRVINFSANNYLGLADHPQLIAAAEAATRREGFGSGASRLIVGNLSAHRRLEERIASWKGTEAALLFNSGYQANIGLVSTLAGPEDAIFSDDLNHASLIDGARLSRATVFVYRHCDVAALTTALAGAARFRRRLVITDSLFSMDGDVAPLAAIVETARRHDALTLVDDAHAVGVAGDAGVGLCRDLGVNLQMGTLGKALGGFGAYVAASRPLVELLLNRARSFIFTTALPVPVVAWAHAAIDLLSTPEGESRRARLSAAARRFHEGIQALGLPAPERPSHILPIVTGDARRTMAISEALLDRGIFAQGIRPPTVPEGTSRLRFALMATHTDAHIDAALSALGSLRSQLLQSNNNS